ncbi:hypothetical protein [Nannocystis punicea]|uniref:YjbH domain-containing protein n=1 Tax=Nannocystis punicea TaxID=2995304 RepID=A0ABY7H3X3_9BACT|nr:hypothetical protein [Nannocystis poenicansa]WAS93971.1 hypothetical protein O0S08_48180 [Nannocystis poenicansa]
MLLSIVIAASMLVASPAPQSQPAPAPALGTVSVAPPQTTLQRLEVPQTPASETTPRRSPREALRRYLTRPVARSVRYLDHGVIEVGVALGLPEIYRLELQVGLLDHVTLGATAHWLPGQVRPNWSPKAAVAFYRGRLLEVGAFYQQVLYPPTRDDGDPKTIEFPRRAHYLMASVSLSQAWFTGGFDIGWARGREALALLTPDDLEAGKAFVVRDRLGGGLHLRFGTRRVGVTMQGWYPYLAAELVLDVRFGAFEMRRRGGWREL